MTTSPTRPASNPLGRLTTADAVIDALGGTKAVADILSVGASSVSNYRRLGFPARAHFLLAKTCEARGLDVTPGMITLFTKAGDQGTVDALSVIYAEEVGHVAYGSKWFNFLCGRENLDPKSVFHDLVQKYFKGGTKPPFNEEKRAEAGLPPDFYWPLVDEAIAARY